MEERTPHAEAGESIDSRPSELDLKEREIRAKEREVALKEAEQKITARRNPLLWSLIGAALVAVVSLFGNIYVQYRQNRGNQDLAERQARADQVLAEKRAEADLELQRRKVRGDLIIEIIRTGNPDKARKNLLFLIHAGLLEDPGGRIETLLKQREAPTLPPLGSSVPYQAPFGSLIEFELQVFENGKPVPEASISCNGKRTETTDLEGRYICMIPAGSRTVHVVAEAGDYGYSDTISVDQHVINLIRRSK